MLLAIETSCDETGVALISEEGKLISHLLYSQVAIHSTFGGIVPEIASRKQLEVLYPLTQKLLEESGKGLSDIKAIAVTMGPGLIGSLLVGATFAKGLAMSLKIPFISVDHLAGHIFSIFLEKEVSFPFIALLVSGGHTILALVKSYKEIYVIGQTRDDAVGEAFDKVARLLGLPYPGGPEISKLADKGNPDAIDLPRPLLKEETFDFSFSGLKTAILKILKEKPNIKKEDLAASFEKCVCEVLVEKSIRALEKFKIDTLVVSGGVAANKTLRKIFQERARNKQIFFPSPEFCMDNAAMIGMYGFFKWKNQEFSFLKEDVYTRHRFPKIL